MKQIGNGRGGIDAELEFCERFRWVIHGGRAIDCDETSQVGLFFILLGIEPIGTCEDLPVYMTCALSLIVKPVLGKFHRKAVVRRFVQSGNKPLHQLPGEQLKTPGLLNDVKIYFQ